MTGGRVSGGQVSGGRVSIQWLRSAAEARFEQLDYVALTNAVAAARLDEEIERQIDRLAQEPVSGRVGRVPGTREVVISRTPFIAVFRVQEGCIEILQLLHGARMWPAHGAAGTPEISLAAVAS